MYSVSIAGPVGRYSLLQEVVVVKVAGIPLSVDPVGTRSKVLLLPGLRRCHRLQLSRQDVLAPLHHGRLQLVVQSPYRRRSPLPLIPAVRRST